MPKFVVYPHRTETKHFVECGRFLQAPPHPHHHLTHSLLDIQSDNIQILRFVCHWYEKQCRYFCTVQVGQEYDVPLLSRIRYGVCMLCQAPNQIAFVDHPSSCILQCFHRYPTPNPQAERATIIPHHKCPVSSNVGAHLHVT